MSIYLAELNIYPEENDRFMINVQSNRKKKSLNICVHYFVVDNNIWLSEKLLTLKRKVCVWIYYSQR
jgi:hypothetical protein